MTALVGFFDPSSHPPLKEQIQALLTLFKILQSLMLVSKPLSYATKRFSSNQLYEIYSFTTLRDAMVNS